MKGEGMPSRSGGKDNLARWVIVLAGVMFVVSVAALVALSALGASTETLQRLVAPLLTAVVVTGVLGVTQRSQESRLEDIERQTNGEMDAKIVRGTRKALDEHDRNSDGWQS